MTELALAMRCDTQDFTLSLNCGIPLNGICAIYGPSGSGKTTLLESIAGLRSLDETSHIRFGNIDWHNAGYSVPVWQRRIGFVFQDARLFPHLSVVQNLLFGAHRTGRGELNPDQVIDWLGLEDLLHRGPNELSAGQKQRVAIGRAVLSEPQLMLLDEPLANLDTAARTDCLQAIRSVQEKLATPMLYVSHDIEEICQLAEHVVVLEQGAVREQGPLIELFGRLDTGVAHEEHAAAVAQGQISKHDEAYGLTAIDVDGHTLWVNHLVSRVGESRRIRIPARDVSVCRERPAGTSILNILPVELVEIEHTSSARVLLRLRLGQQYLLARITRKSAIELQLQTGEQLFAQIKSAALLSDTGKTP